MKNYFLQKIFKLKLIKKLLMICRYSFNSNKKINKLKMNKNKVIKKRKMKYQSFHSKIVKIVLFSYLISIYIKHSI